MSNGSPAAVDATLAIGELAHRAGIQASAIRYYERIGLLSPPERRGGQRRYEPTAVRLLAAIGAAKDAGFSLREIRQLFHGFDGDLPASDRWRRLAADKLRELDALAVRIEAMRRLLEHGLECGCLRLEDCELVQPPPAAG